MFGYSLSRVIVLGLGLVVFLAGLGLFFSFSRGLPEKRPEGAAPPPANAQTFGEKLGTLQERLAGVEGKVDTLNTLAQQLKDDETVRAKVRLVEIANKVKEIEKNLSALETELTGWEGAITAILQDEEGRKLAADKTRLERFAAIVEKHKPGAVSASAMKDQLAAFVDFIGSSPKKGEAKVMPSDSLVADLDKLNHKVKDVLRDHLQAKVAFKGLQLESKESSAAGKNLADALSEFEMAKQKKRLEELAALRKIVFEENTKKLLTQEEEAAKKLAEIELARQKVSQESEQLKKQILLNAEKKVLERKKLEARFDEALPDIKSLLMPFITDGYAQPNTGMGGRFERTAEKKPISLSLLKGAGYLDKKVYAMQGMFGAIGDSRVNDRPLGAFPAYGVGDATWARTQPIMERVQELLIEFGELMVEKKMLSP